MHKNLPLLDDWDADILIIDDGSTDGSSDLIREYPSLKYIRHEQSVGYGAAFITGCEYARDFDYEFIISMDHTVTRFHDEARLLLEQISYGYDIVTSSRILENTNFRSIPPEHISIVSEMSTRLKEITSYDLTDPLSGIKALRTDAFRRFSLTEPTHGVFLQLWIQARFFEMNILEIPVCENRDFGHEHDLYDDPLGFFLSIMETEKYLYSPNTQI